MSTKTSDRNLALKSQTLMSLALLSAAPMKKTRRWILEEEIIRKGWKTNDGGVELEVDDHNFRPVWKDDADGYLQGVRECGSSTTEKWERKRKLEKSAPTIRSIVDIFPTQLNKNQFSGKGPLPTLPAVSPPKISKEKVRETRFKSQTRAVHDLGELLCLKTVQIDRYGHVLDYKPNLYLRHQMVNSFL